MVVYAGRAPLVGRRKELGVLERLLDEAGAGVGGVVLLSGEAGVGKTRLVAEVAAQARARGWRVLAGRAYDSEGMPPYIPFVEALRAYPQGVPPALLAAQLGEDAGVVALLLPELERRLPGAGEWQPNPDRALLAQPSGAPGADPAGLGSQAPVDRYRFFEAITDFLLAIARDAGPTPAAGLLLILDDLQWAERAALLLLLHLARRLVHLRLAAERMAPILVAAAYRSTEIEQSHPLTATLADLRREQLAERLPLTRLDPAAIPPLVEALNGAPPAAEVSEAILRATNGNAFFVEELVRHLLAEGRDLAAAETAQINWGVPQGVREVLARRLARLSEDATKLLQAVAVLGDGYAFDVLADVCDVEVEPLLTALEEVLAAGILREERESYDFSHALIRHAVLLTLSAPRRQRLHLRAGRALEQSLERGDRVTAAVALHFRLAGPAGRDQALAYGQQAAEEATAVYAWEEAAAHYQAALSLLSANDDERRCELLLALGEAQTRTGANKPARQTFNGVALIARSLGRPEYLARAALGTATTGAILGSRQSSRELNALLNEALDALGNDHGRLRALLLARRVQGLYWSGAAKRHEGLGDRTVAVARRTGDVAALAGALWARYWALDGPDEIESRLAVGAEVLRLAEESGDAELVLLGRRWRLHDLLELGAIEQVEAEVEAYACLAEELRQPYYLWHLRVLRATQSLMGGRLGETEQLLDEALAARQGVEEDEAGAYEVVQRYALLRHQGRLAEVEVALHRRAEAPGSVLAWRCLLVCLYAEVGRVQEAECALERLARDGFALIPRDRHWLNALTSLADTCSLIGARSYAADLYGLLRPYLTRVVVVSTFADCRGSVARSLGLLAALLERWEEAQGYFEEALVANARLGLRPWLARTQCEYAVMLLTRTQDSGLRTQVGARHAVPLGGLLADALATAEELGLAGLAEQIRYQIQSSPPSLDSLDSVERKEETTGSRRASHDSPPPVASLSPWPSLTARETEVLTLLASGRTNQEIADELVLALRTVHRHVANIYGKIGARGRVEAAAYAFSHGIARPPEG